MINFSLGLQFERRLFGSLLRKKYTNKRWGKAHGVLYGTDVPLRPVLLV